MGKIEGYQNILKHILNWNFGKEKYLNIVSPPYNTCEVFLELIIENVKVGNKILYITEEKDGNVEILKLIKDNSQVKEYSYYRGNELHEDTKVVVSNYENAFHLNLRFDMIIYDDIRSLSQYSRIEIIELLDSLKNDNCRVIAYSIESMLDNCRTIYIPARNDMLPIVEPRIITTGVNINKDMPFVAFEYLKWFINIKNNVVIPISDENMMLNLFGYLTYSKLGIDKRILLYRKDNSSKNVLNKVNGAIIITNDFERVCEHIQNISVAVYFYEQNKFSYKTLVYFCGRLRGGYKRKGEAIFITNKENKEIEKAKNITRNFNKTAWEEGLFSI
ncbi:hypothetical protein ACJDT4_08545 [Clostridium neuense]|uniref:Comf operon protein A, DNA transporter ATPase n=1 Tax=Clostridium neuense TaxID=1728934 RepID=A0ABW8TDR9_9CLOT